MDFSQKIGVRTGLFKENDVSCIGRRVLYHERLLGCPELWQKTHGDC